MTLLLKKKYPDSKVFIFGKTPYKLDHFSLLMQLIKLTTFLKMSELIMPLNAWADAAAKAQLSKSLPMSILKRV